MIFPPLTKLCIHSSSMLGLATIHSELPRQSLYLTILDRVVQAYGVQP